jgi:energy-converting hydrogenase Eha subunit B
MLGLRRRFAGTVLEPISEHPLRAAGGVFAVAAAVVTWLGVRASAASQSAGDAGTVTFATVADYAAAHPAYPAAILIGLGVLFFAD